MEWMMAGQASSREKKHKEVKPRPILRGSGSSLQLALTEEGTLRKPSPKASDAPEQRKVVRFAAASAVERFTFVVSCESNPDLTDSPYVFPWFLVRGILLVAFVFISLLVAFWGPWGSGRAEAVEGRIPPANAELLTGSVTMLPFGMAIVAAFIFQMVLILAVVSACAGSDSDVIDKIEPR
ncbi:unnamed protein product [Polarella glacialis]|uniref:Uncharacterized protein n=1 Tax=Polarella glacialis TaxID=89957 RepID=A0A813FT55_POLGL|nr:unnamed protein product [Polarella glacialis]CAE8709486.1 unnamed protein product [Polarella glacialis]|mmetsp:Transcript_15756/g.27987  ORF Transcript_15756/g.27987 Transcript_15756/m.27987 type:complete len:181 (-) Transcript_15756:117-659(-)